MNSAVITKIEHKLPPASSFSEFVIVPESGKLRQDSKLENGETIYNAVVDFLIAGVTTELNELMNLMNNRKATFKCTDADNVVYLVGSTNYMARFNAQLDLGGTPGSFKGYRCSITLISPEGCTVQ